MSGRPRPGGVHARPRPALTFRWARGPCRLRRGDERGDARLAPSQRWLALDPGFRPGCPRAAVRHPGAAARAADRVGSGGGLPSDVAR